MLGRIRPVLPRVADAQVGLLGGLREEEGKRVACHLDRLRVPVRPADQADTHPQRLFVVDRRGGDIGGNGELDRPELVKRRGGALRLRQERRPGATVPVLPAHEVGTDPLGDRLDVHEQPRTGFGEGLGAREIEGSARQRLDAEREEGLREVDREAVGNRLVEGRHVEREDDVDRTVRRLMHDRRLREIPQVEDDGAVLVERQLELNGRVVEVRDVARRRHHDAGQRNAGRVEHMHVDGRRRACPREGSVGRADGDVEDLGERPRDLRAQANRVDLGQDPRGVGRERLLEPASDPEAFEPRDRGLRRLGAAGLEPVGAAVL